MTDGRINGANRPTQPLNRPRATANIAAANGPGMAGDGNTVSNATRLLAGLKGNEGLEAVTPAQWQGVIKAVDGLSHTQLQNLQISLLKQGLLLKVNPDAGEISLFGQQGAVTGETGGSHRLRVNLDGATTVYEGTKAIETISLTMDKKFLVTREGKAQIWDPRTGQGTVDGKPIPPRYADPIKGEAPRKAWAAPPAKKFAEPADGDPTTAEYQQLYNDAVKASGGEVVEKLSMTRDNESERYNCHSFATTGAHGDLADPFDRIYAPRWVNFPTFQLANGPFKELKPDQKVHVGDVVLYKKDGVPTHTGKVIAVDADGNPTRIESKWGAYGLYKHGVSDVPAIYGEVGAIYRPE